MIFISLAYIKEKSRKSRKKRHQGSADSSTFDKDLDLLIIIYTLY
jgi:hypothetical protein